MYLKDKYDSYGDDHFAKISYKMQAYTYMNAVKGGYYRVDKDKKIDCEQKLIVKAEQTFDGQMKHGSMRTKMTTWCCLDQGESKIKATVGKNVYAVGETVEACAEIDNSECSLDIQNVSVSLINRLTLRADGRTRHFTTTTY